MAARADLTGQRVQGWTVSRKAPAQTRVPFWLCVHDACQSEAGLPHATLTKAIAGKSTLPPCTTCVPADDRPRISHGMHLACGQSHLIGTPCPDGVQREPAAGNRAPAEIPADPHWRDFDETHALDYELQETSCAVSSATAGASGLSPLALSPTSVNPATAPAAVAANPGIADVVHGRVDRLEEPQDVLDVIRRAIIGAPRAQQQALGPSEYGGCERKLGHRLAFGKNNDQPLISADSQWRPTVGTAGHAWLSEVFGGAMADTGGRWLTDVAVTMPIAGTLDLFDTMNGRVIDFKFSGEAVRAKAAKGEVSDRYEVQLDLYALGMMAAGHRVESVALLFLPPNGSLSEAVWYSRPVNIARALTAIERHNRVRSLLANVARNEDIATVLDGLEATEDYCSGCAALGKYCKGAETAWIRNGLPDSAWPAYDAAVKALGGAA